ADAAEPARAAAHARRCALERDLDVDERRHGDDPARSPPPRRERHPAHDRAGAMRLAQHRGGRVRTTAARRASSWPLRRLVPALRRERRRRAVERQQTGADGTHPGLRIVDIVGSSESGRQGIGTGTATGAFEPSPTACVLSEDRTRRLAPGDPEIGWLAQTGRIPRGYLGDRAKTEQTFPVIDGVRYVVAGDRARVRADGRIELLGR